jgi:hypothetical protein
MRISKMVIGVAAVVLPTVAVAPRLDPLAVSTSIEDRRPGVVRHAVVTPPVVSAAVEVDLRSWLSEPHERLSDSRSKADVVPPALREELVARETERVFGVAPRPSLGPVGLGPS